MRSEVVPGAGWQLVCDSVWLRPLSMILGSELGSEMPLKLAVRLVGGGETELF